MLAVTFSLLFPSIIFALALVSLRHVLGNRLHGLAAYAWAGLYACVGAFGGVWLARSASTLTTEGLPEELAAATLATGPYLFAALLIPLLARPTFLLVCALIRRAREPGARG